jgi:hypothetical protein
VTADDIDSSLEHESFLLAVYRDMRLSPAELAAANRALAEWHGFRWREEWVVSHDREHERGHVWQRPVRGRYLPRSEHGRS